MINKKLIITFIILLLLLGAVVFLVLYFSKKEIPKERKFTTAPPQEEKNSSPQNIVYASSIERLIPENVILPIPNAQDNKILYIDRETSGIYEFDPVLRTKEKIGSPHPGNITFASWSPDKKKVILNYENEDLPPHQNFGSDGQKFVYDLETNQEFPLHKNIQNVIFGRNSDEIFYQFIEGVGKTKISKADYTGLNWKNLIDYPLDNVRLGLIPNSKLIYFCPSPSAFQKTACYSLTESGQNLKTITQEEYGQNIKYSQNGEKILYTSTTKKGMELNLNLMDSDGTHKKYLQVNTLVEKCTFGGDNKIYCAVPEFIPTDSAMPDDYYNKKFVTDDIFWEIDIEELTKTRLTEIKDFKWGNNDAINLFFLKDKKNLFFVSNGGLYVLHLENL